MTVEAIFEPPKLDLGDALTALLDKGVVIRGDATISVADIDLIQLDLGVLLVAIETAMQRRPARSLLAPVLGAPVLTPERAGQAREREGSRGATPSPVARPEAALKEVAPALPERINVDPSDAGSDLARLVLTLIEVLRKVLEHQAIRRMEGGGLSEQEIERLGVALLRLHDRIQELKDVFGLSDEDLQIDLGPLGRLR